jgi:hypothetical protein
VSAKAFGKSPQPAGFTTFYVARIRDFPKLPHSQRPQFQSDLCRPGKPLALGFAQNLFPVFLEEDGRNIRVRNIKHPAPPV